MGKTFVLSIIHIKNFLYLRFQFILRAPSFWLVKGGAIF